MSNIEDRRDSALDRDWHAGALLRFALPTMVMMLSMGLYTLVDTIFVARFVHTDALSAVNIVCPAINVTVGLGTIFSTAVPGIPAEDIFPWQEGAYQAFLAQIKEEMRNGS